MCGIIAHLSFDDQCRISEPHLKQLNDLLTHRGPDDQGLFLQGNVALSMRRLSIVDLPGGHQPMTSADGRFTIVFNGEIYNHRDLRAVLLKLGFPAHTHSDTETLLYACAAWGKECVGKLNGMFAFAVWDRKEQELFVARDRVGMKPLYYASDGKRIMFASELTPIARSGFFDARLNHKAICDYLSYWYICEPETIFRNIYQLPPGHYALIRKGQMRIQRYWQIPAEKEQDISFNEAARQLDHLLKDAVKLHLGADVPLGTFLIGGIDSGLVTAMAAAQVPRQIQSFAIGFKEAGYDETPLARISAQRHGVRLDVHIMEDITPPLVEEIISAFDEPLGNASYVPAYLLARAARAKMKVVLTGDGGDELFGGYPTYQAPYYQNMWQSLPGPLKNLIKQAVHRLPVSHRRISLDYRLKQLMQGIDLDYRRAHCAWREVCSLAAQKDLWREELWGAGSYDPFNVAARYFARAKGLSVVNQLMYVDLNTYLLNDHLRKVDRMTMAHGLEARIPLLDHRIVEFAMRLPAEHKITLSRTKKILKAVARRYLPPQVIKGEKKGLTSPIAGWLSQELKDYAGDQLKGGIVEELFQKAAVDKLCRDHWDKRKDHSRLLWALLTLQVWHKNLK
ncbi:MAG: asparagine synthase (glutamine-hydrolyzing) [Candidatus Omnitrophica bacterium]|nr:asparagine synthase (glutamine-hydrolyzing) [Candidatus Omnitrophota bacterium]